MSIVHAGLTTCICHLMLGGDCSLRLFGGSGGCSHGLAFLLFILGDKKSCAINDKLEKLDISLVFIFFDGEEAIKKWTATDSLYGSRYFAENIDSEVKDFTKNVKLFVLLDLLGSKDPKFNIFHFTHHKCFSKLRGIENDLKSKKSKSCNSNLQYDTSYKRNYFSTNMLSRG